MPQLTKYKVDLAPRFNGACLDKEDGKVVDISVLHIEDSLPSNAMMFGMTQIANVLTTRTVNTYTSWLTPFGQFELGPTTEKC